ncbi:methyltransferase domain-containing protein [Streptomyces sp. 8N114]|uniref:methyltransferase domain-containing protein n=1 Tax=Streptomyces sp. 8N114 TaxID=3457419 RepID=UPI003FD1AED4
MPDTIETPRRTISRSADPDDWLTAVYGDLPLTTQVNDGCPTTDGEFRLPTSSSSMPSLMLEMLDLLQVADGHRVLDVGAGTGLQTAWLAHRLGSDNVVAVDVDPVLVEQAAKNVQAAGYSPAIMCGDGAAGWPQGAPYDRIIATYTVPEIPYAWVEQAPGGRIVAPWGGSFFSHSFVALSVTDGEAHGRFSGYPAFMRSRTGRPPRGYLSDFLHHQDEAVETRTAINPLKIAHDADAQFWVGLALPDAWHMEVEAEDGSDEVTWWLLADDRSSWAAADYVPGQSEYVIAQYGPRRLWDEVTHAWRAWNQHGKPQRDRAGITVTAEGQRVWIDNHNQVVHGSDQSACLPRERGQVLGCW